MKQVIVMRSDLNMRKGKMIAQGAHASMKVLVENADDKRILSWLANSFTKIVVRVDSEDELLTIYNQAKEAGILSALITDNGATEFGGVKTNTCIAIGPDESDNIDKITGHLKLL